MKPTHLVQMLRTPTGCIPPDKWSLAAAKEIMRLRRVTKKLKAKLSTQLEAY